MFVRRRAVKHERNGLIKLAWRGLYEENLPLLMTLETSVISVGDELLSRPLSMYPYGALILVKEKLRYSTLLLSHSDPLHSLADSLLWHVHPQSTCSDFSVSDVVFAAAGSSFVRFFFSFNEEIQYKNQKARIHRMICPSG